MKKRTLYCGDVTEKHIGEKVTLHGWVQKRRDLGGLIFIDLRDREGIVQVVFNPDFSADALSIAESVRNEFVVTVVGKVAARSEGAINDKLATGRIEVLAEEIEVLNASKTPPFYIEDGVNVSDELRLKYRYLDLRRPEMNQIFQMRHTATKTFRQKLDQMGFFDIETPYLTKSTPEGARDYLVPSRVYPGNFYALPQSPQILKQLLMSAGFDKYYQVVRCFRDEDLRGDRQPEFTQIDLETSFLTKEEIQEITEEMLVAVVEATKGIKIAKPFPHMTYAEAMDRFGSDKPDVRFGLELKNVAEAVANVDFKVFTNAIESGGEVKAINAKGAAANYSRKDIDALGEFVGRYGAKGLAWMKVEEDGFKGPIAKFFTPENQAAVAGVLDAEVGDLLLFVADKAEVVAASLGALRSKLGQELDLIDQNELAFLWVTDWPLFEYDEEAGRFVSAHHPFTMPQDASLLETAPEKAMAEAYDIVLNGYEIGGGSLRIYKKEMQQQMFRALGFTDEEATEQFGFLLEALEFGTPPHGGIALGLDRIIMILAGRNNLRDTIAFPKTGSAADPLTNAPSEVSAAQLAELELAIEAKKAE
ncbi:aspartate--tRNA ligase [Listeria newyorkensis]|uniref:Aspartate--tRNA(Asp/Asn) ligase n=1 Tax=Listeria newyorkensis TaxID=1497681 RepID=A0ABX4XL53_9LIST|nr:MULTISPECIES: aspartate--tRNA ligase [Listeria]KGL45380.1 aspartate--tRNA ligase [Listeriaceae bacterium FSL A5-0209]KGL45940.1 aspartate--tRNA ligase [Listeria newyorkensis]PNP90495.1 aspartate--tRNA ligase [Listeria newyorkensis]RQW67993.1 aspartate--tRNA ligase [Listeria sp. SHR_NRA_18]WAO20999.1 aspartate--tRNA ligase [Listeria newyorkensis]